MASLQGDCSIGIKVETAWGTAVTVDKHIEFLSETLQKNIGFLQGAGLRAGKVTDRLDRRIAGKVEAVGDIVCEVDSVDSGLLFGAALGKTQAGTTGTAMWALYTPATTDKPPSYTIQKGLPLIGGGAVQPHTFKGMCCSQFQLAVGADAVLQLTTSWTGKDMDTSTSLVTPAYTSGNGVYGFHQASKAQIGGTLTPTTASALGSMTGGAVTDVRDFNLTWNNNLDGNGWNLGGAGLRSRAPAYGMRHGTVTFTAEFDAITLRDAYLAGTSMPVLLAFALDTDHALQIEIPSLVLEPGSMPQSNGGDVITASVSGTIKDNGTNQALQVVLQSHA